MGGVAAPDLDELLLLRDGVSTFEIRVFDNGMEKSGVSHKRTITGKALLTGRLPRILPLAWM
jgi:hypothetical protein